MTGEYFIPFTLLLSKREAACPLALHGSPELKSTLVNSTVKFDLNYLFQAFAWPH